MIISMTSVITFFSISVKSQVKNNDSPQCINELRIKVLEADSVGKDYEYDLTGQEGCKKTKLTYLGFVTTKNQKKYKLLNSFWVTGYSCRGISSLYIYDMNNVYIGNYSFDMPYELPDALINNEIVYYTNHEDCESRKGRRISFKNGLPKTFHVCGGIRSFY